MVYRGENYSTDSTLQAAYLWAVAMAEADANQGQVFMGMKTPYIAQAACNTTTYLIGGMAVDSGIIRG